MGQGCCKPQDREFAQRAVKSRIHSSAAALGLVGNVTGESCQELEGISRLTACGGA